MAMPTVSTCAATSAIGDSQGSVIGITVAPCFAAVRHRAMLWRS